MLEWECCLKHQDEGAREGAAFIRNHIIKVQGRAFDALMKPTVDQARLARILGVGEN